MLLVDESETWKQAVPELFAVRLCVDHEVAGTDKPFNQADGFKYVRGIVKCSHGPLKRKEELFEGLGRERVLSAMRGRRGRRRCRGWRRGGLEAASGEQADPIARLEVGE